MKRLTNLWPQLVSFENLWLAWRKARKGKRSKAATIAFSLNLEAELLALQRELQNGSYCPGAYRLFTIYEGKPRTIAAAPFRDRVVHHALLNLIEAPLDRRFIHDSYACRKGKGVHKAVARYQEWAQRYRYALQMDVQQYFPSIDHDILRAKIARYIKDERVLALIDLIIATSPPVERTPVYFPGNDLFTPLQRRAGIPIGNLTSQFFANLYLNDLDHWLKDELGLPAYLRYVDDLIVPGDDKGRLIEIRGQVRDKLDTERLCLHPRKAHIVPTRCGLDVFGYRVYPEIRRLRNGNGHRFSCRLRRFAKLYAAGLARFEDFHPSVHSWIGHARHADTKNLREVLFSGIVFRRESAGRSSGSAGRFLEQQTREGAFRQPQQKHAGQA
ncbi:MAG: RNA-directed DNA polymerase [Gammaproteobacteria bacterium]|nr:RNA-directed DNA polymerase [Gammaproteobacteria bacterium]